ncbi:MAG TPA: LemA family protein [Longimicrobiales bacterium]
MVPILVIAALLALVFVIYNGLVKLRVQAESAWADIDVQLKRRHDLIPNLVETVKGYATHERGALEAVIDARSRALGASGPAAKGAAEGELSGAVRGLFALAESYPELRASENFAQLQQSLMGIEEALANARRYYNAVVRDLNTKIQQFPGNMLASAFAIRQQEFFEVGEAERATPRVSF